MKDIQQNVPWNSVKSLCLDASKDSPRPGKLVHVARGKHRGKSGLVTWHGPDKFYDRHRYGSALSNILSDSIGIHGFRVRIQPDSGKAFFTACENLRVDNKGAIV